MAVVIDQPAQRVLHAAECGGDLHQLPELDRAAEKPGCRDNEGKHHRRLAKKRREPDQVFLLFDQLQVIGQHLGKARVEVAALDRLAFVERNRLAVFAHANQVVAKVGLIALL